MTAKALLILDLTSRSNTPDPLPLRTSRFMFLTGYNSIMPIPYFISKQTRSIFKSTLVLLSPMEHIEWFSIEAIILILVKLNSLQRSCLWPS